MTRRLLSTQNLVNLASDPVSAIKGDQYYNTTSNKTRYYNGSTWKDVDTTDITQMTSGAAADTKFVAANGSGGIILRELPFTVSGTTKLTVGTVTPTNPSVGDIWIDMN